jgi:hypothetical protein
MRTGAVFVLLLLLGGCWNENSSIHFGDVSLGQQLIDLKAALDQGAVTEEEYERLKGAIMSLSGNSAANGD